MISSCSMTQTGKLVVISPCRNEADFMERTLDSVLAQTYQPDLWIIVDDGSSDATPDIIDRYSAAHEWIVKVEQPDRGQRAVGPGVVDAFYTGLDAVERLQDFTYICKLDLDLDLPPGYFEGLISRMKTDPRIGTCSGKPYVMRNSTLVSERRGDEMSAGMTKFYRRSCFEDIGGFVREVMWDAIDCHKARQKGWRAISWDDADLRFEHLRPMGSSQISIYEGRRRHGFGQYFMGSDPLYFVATAVFRALEPPYVLGGLAMLQGYFGAALRRAPRLEDPSLINFIRTYQRRVLRVGRAKAVSEIEKRLRPVWEKKTSLS